MQIIDMDAHPPFGTMDIPYLGMTDAGLFFKRLRKAGIGTAAGTLLLPQETSAADLSEEQMRAVNAASWALAKAFPDSYIPGIDINPAHRACSCREIERYGAMGVRIIGEILPAWLDNADCHDSLAEILSCAGQFRMIVRIHTAKPEQLAFWAERFPRLHFVYGSGEYPGITPEQSCAVLREHPNLYVCLSQVIYLGNYYLHTFADRFPPRQIVFGSGYPLCNPAAHTAGCLWELRDQKETVRQSIFYENAKRCLADTREDGEK